MELSLAANLRTRCQVSVAVLVVFLAGSILPVQAATVLIKDEEAQRQDAPVPEGDLGGFSRRPEIAVLEPIGAVTAPFRFAVRFKAHGSAKIVVPNIRVYYHKKGPIEITQRLRAGLSADGINIDDALTPPRKHTLRIELEDSEGQKEVSFVKLEIVK